MSQSVFVRTCVIEGVLARAPFRYPSNSVTEFYKGWSAFPALPSLWQLTIDLGYFPTADIGVDFLMQHLDKECDPGATGIINRAHKLYMDFARDIHTFGLFQQNERIHYISYKESNDMRNVDFVITLDGTTDSIGIQASMRANWGEEDDYEIRKQQRRKDRGGTEWEGEIYWLTNRCRPVTNMPNGCWLFSPEHISDLLISITQGF